MMPSPRLPEPMGSGGQPVLDDQGNELSMLGAFGSELQNKLRDNLRQRRPIETRWVNDMRRYQGLVTDSELKSAADQGRSCVFVKYTRTKADS